MPTENFELQLGNAAEAMAAPVRGQAGRSPARGLQSHLRRQGFLVTRHFLDRWLERAQLQGIRFNPRTFGADFRQSPHFRQTRPGYRTRIALMQGLPVLYRMGGPRGKNPVLVGLLPHGALPPVAPISSPRVFEAEPEAEPESAAFELEGEAFFGWPSGGLSAIARWFWSYWGRQLEVAKRGFLQQKYGCWCGKGNVCSTVTDSLDGCCRAHDAAYGAVRVGTAGGADMWTVEGLKRTVPADEALVGCSNLAINDGTPYGPAARAYQQGIVGIFGTRAAAGRAVMQLGL